MTDELPAGWARVRVRDICTLINGRAFKPSEWSSEGLRIIRIQNLNDPAKPFNRYAGRVDPKHVIDPGELLFAWSGTPGTSFGAHIWRGSRSVLNQHIFRVRFPEDLCDKHFLRLAINQRLGELIDLAHGGAGLAHVTKPMFESTELAIPPLAEQRRIVAKVESVLQQVDRVRDRLAKVPLILKRFRQAVLAAACTGKFTAAGREQGFPSVDELLASLGVGTVPEEDKPEADIPPTWQWVAAQDLCDRARPITYGVIKLGPPTRNGVPTLRSSDVRRLFIDESNIKSIARDIAKEYARTYLRGGEVLVTVRGSLGGVAVVPARMAGFNVSREVAVLPIRQPVNPDYVAYAIASQASQEWLANRARGVAYTGINIGDLRRLSLPLPPAEEQAEIVRVVRQLLLLADRIEERVRASLARAENLPHAILSKAFSGGLVVSEAELASEERGGYESPHALLERIRHERGASASKAVASRLNRATP